MSEHRKWRVLLVSLTAFSVLIVLLACASLYVSQTSWFRRQVRSHIISAIQRASGGRVEMKAFHYDWRSLTAELSGFVLHGSEPPGAPPLFRADRIRIGFHIVSLVRRNIDLESIVIEAPRVYMLVRPDGSTNIPVPPDSTLRTIPQELIDLGVKRFELNHGFAQLNEKQMPLNVRGEDLRAGLQYVPSRSLYRGTLSSRILRVVSDWAQPLTAGVRASFAIGRDHAAVKKLEFVIGGSKLEGTAVVQHFRSPSGRFQLRATVDAPEAARLLQLSGVRSGDVQIAGAGIFANNSYSFTGTTNGRDLGYRDGRLAISRVGFHSDVSLNAGGLFLTKLVVNALGANLSGEAQLPHFHQIHLSARVDGLGLRQAARLLMKQPLPWSGALDRKSVV